MPARPSGERRDALPPGPELFIGVVGAVGTNLDAVTRAIELALQSVGYHTEPVRLSELFDEVDLTTLPGWTGHLDDSSQDLHIETRMDAGNAIRIALDRGDAVALFAMMRIRQRRRELAAEGVTRRAFVLRSLKHPAEVEALRRTYGENFYLISAYSPEDRRVEYLARRIARDKHVEDASRFKAQAGMLIDRDRLEEGIEFGQRVRDTFPKADLFVDARLPGGRFTELDTAIKRFVELLFNHPYHTPNRDEQAMFCAQAAALRSAALGRQVGACITNEHGDVIALGAVPKAHGGQYWSTDAHDSRDFLRETDDSVEMKRLVMEQILDRLKAEKEDESWLKEEHRTATIADFSELIAETRVRDLIEFERVTHAEMAAILDAARRGAPVERATLYTTTFPCHECTRHVITVGIRRLVYIEPYPKSLAERLHDDSVVIDADDPPEEKVCYEPFVGVAPRRYLELFSATDRRVEGHRRPATPSEQPKALRMPIEMEETPETSDARGVEGAEATNVAEKVDLSDAPDTVLADPAIKFNEDRSVAEFLALLEDRGIKLLREGS